MKKLVHLFRAFFAIALLSSSPLAWAEVAKQCQLKATINGDTSVFWMYGTDSWLGTGAIECDKTSHPVSVHLSSWQSGGGVYPDDVLDVLIEAIPVDEVQSLFASFRVARITTPPLSSQNPYARLFASAQNVESQNVKWTVLVSIRNPDRGFSLNYGLLTIAPHTTNQEEKP
ncbi:MAG: hypothetical protein AB7N80_02920 [Bdellovibrionales bacterium]